MSIPSEYRLIAEHGFLPELDPACHFDPTSDYHLLDQIGQELPQRLQESTFRQTISEIRFPHWKLSPDNSQYLSLLHLYYVRMGFIASAYINQTGQPAVHSLPENIARPLADACNHLRRPPILSYDGYALYNWRRLNPDMPIALGNIDTIQNFVKLYDEHWFILVHVDIEALAARQFSQVLQFPGWIQEHNTDALENGLAIIRDTLQQQTNVLKRIPEHMDPNLYFKTFRPYIRFIENIRFEGTDLPEQSQRGETGAQSSIMPALVSFMKIPHKQTMLTEHLHDMRRYMPDTHRQFISWIETSVDDFRDLVSADAFNGVLRAMAEFRQVHYGWADQYIHQHTSDPRGTGGTPYMQWLKLLIDETLAFQK